MIIFSGFNAQYFFEFYNELLQLLFRGVARYLKTLFDEESGLGRKSVAIDHLLSGKTRKEASRMFFETLVRRLCFSVSPLKKWNTYLQLQCDWRHLELHDQEYAIHFILHVSISHLLIRQSYWHQPISVVIVKLDLQW